MTYRRSTAAFIVASLFIAGLGTGAWAGATAVDRARSPYEGLDLIARVLTLVEDRYVDDVDQRQLTEAAVRGMVSELDEHSLWMDAETYRSFRDDTHGTYEGIGVEINVRPDGVEVVKVIPHGPAERDGVLAGDLITAANGTSLAGLDLDGVLAQMKGPRGSPVDLTILRPNQAEAVHLRTVRDRIYTPSVEGARIGDLGYIRLVQFQEGCAKDLSDRVDDLNAAGQITGLILDLRDDPGGLLDQAVAVSDLFIDEGPLVSTRGRTDEERKYVATPGGFPATLPVVVLVNGMSASAAEIVASALQDTHRATLIGTATYGKGSVQTVFENPDGSAMKLTIGAYYTPSGEPVAPHNGRVPDVVVAMPAIPGPRARLIAVLEHTEDLSVEAREQLLSLAADLPKEKLQREPVPWSIDPAKRLDRDPQLAAAIAHLHP